MGWAVGYDPNWKRDIGYGVPAICDAPGCNTTIDRGLGYVCGSDVYGGEYGCGLYFCGSHMWHRSPRGVDRSVVNCRRCKTYKLPYTPKTDTQEWISHKLNDPSWRQWREENPEETAKLMELLDDRT